jgi:hypothetical protein
MIGSDAANVPGLVQRYNYPSLTGNINRNQSLLDPADATLVDINED